jgi:hypothetical protein
MFRLSLCRTLSYLVACCLLPQSYHAWQPPAWAVLRTTARRPFTRLCLAAATNNNRPPRRTNVVMPLWNIDIDDKDHPASHLVLPLPAAHLPPELRTMHVYAWPLERPVYQAMVQDAYQRASPTGSSTMDTMLDTFRTSRPESYLGFVAYQPQPDTFVGAMGCAVQLLGSLDPTANDTMEKSMPSTVVGQGAFRFRVKEIRQTIPFPVAVVDEMYDDDDDNDSTATVATVDVSLDEKVAAKGSNMDEKDDDDEADDESDEFAHMDASALIRWIMQGMQTYIQQQLDATSKQLSPLEQTILEQSPYSPSTQREAVEEMTAVFHLFPDYLFEVGSDVVQRYYAVACMAAEMAHFPPDVRRTVLRLTDGVTRLRLVARTLKDTLGMTQARQVAQTIVTQQPEEVSQDLKVGEPRMPPWIKGLRKGMYVDYYWNEEYGWCTGQVVEDPMWIVDEYVVKVCFSDDDTTHKLPFRADEKVRWRPSSGPSSK